MPVGFLHSESKKMDESMPMQDPMMGEEAQEGKSVTITAMPDGTFTVDDQPVGSIDEALELARQMLEDTPEASMRKEARADIAKEVWPAKPPMKPGRGMM